MPTESLSDPSQGRSGPGVPYRRRRSRHTEVVLLDLGLPDMHGHDVARQLRDAAAAVRPILIALTGHVQEEYRHGSKEAGCDYHLVEPVDVEVLRNVLGAIGTSSDGAAAQ